MGADLIVRIMKGPNKITKPNIRRSVKRAQEIIDFASRVVDVQTKDRDTALDLTKADRHLLDTAADHRLLSGVREEEQHDRLEDLMPNIEDISASFAETEVQKFVEWWEGAQGRDTCWTFDPDDQKKRIVVCGDMSHGDAPDGYGYLRARRGYWFDIPILCGIR